MGRRMPYFNYFESGTCNTIDDVDGFKVKLSQTKKRWDGYQVTDANFENRQPQDFQVTPRAPKVYAESRPEQVYPEPPPPFVIPGE